ncbi:MAG TPA: mycofactocin biosynthesis glycosyltransferase MftF [Acidimicrobiales bacterium]|nr:mycofactocin biosynthesis glycosyltransferase MftF [Acidimicrobiales bacterium]
MAGDGWPPGWGVRLSPQTRWVDDRSLIGGAPLRVLHFSPAAARALRSGTPGAGVARAVTDAGAAACVPLPTRPGRWPTWSVVVPVRDRPGGLAATLAALRPAADGVPAPDEVVVVDDGSLEALAPGDGGPGRTPWAVRVLRRERPGGPAPARDDGWRSVGSEVVVFVDADCTLQPGALAVLLTHFADPTLAAVAPRVRSAPGTGVRARFERVRSPLDLGPLAGPVRPRARVAYVPTAALAARRAALESAGGFDTALRVGEDVDLVWRLVAAGWRVRYEPAAVAFHPPRASWWSWARQRWSYGTSAGPLASRHGDAVAPLRGGRLPLGAVAAGVLLGPPWWAAGAAASTVVAVRRLRAAGVPTAAAVRVAAGAQLRAADAVGRALRRAWGGGLWAGVAATGVSGRRRPGRLVLRRPVGRAAALALAPLLVEWATSGCALDPVRYVGLALVDDTAYTCGVVAGAVRSRSLRALLPVAGSA